MVLGSDTSQVKCSGSFKEGESTRTVYKSTMEPIRKKFKGDGEQARDSNCVTQHQGVAGGGFGGSAESTIEIKCRYWSPTGDKAGWGDKQVLQLMLQGIRNKSREQAQGQDFHRLERVCKI